MGDRTYSQCYGTANTPSGTTEARPWWFMAPGHSWGVARIPFMAWAPYQMSHPIGADGPGTGVFAPHNGLVIPHGVDWTPGWYVPEGPAAFRNNIYGGYDRDVGALNGFNNNNMDQWKSKIPVLASVPTSGLPPEINDYTTPNFGTLIPNVSSIYSSNKPLYFVLASVNGTPINFAKMLNVMSAGFLATLYYGDAWGREGYVSDNSYGSRGFVVVLMARSMTWDWYVSTTPNVKDILNTDYDIGYCYDPWHKVEMGIETPCRPVRIAPNGDLTIDYDTPIVMPYGVTNDDYGFEKETSQIIWGSPVILDLDEATMRVRSIADICVRSTVKYLSPGSYLTSGRVDAISSDILQNTIDFLNSWPLNGVNRPVAPSFDHGSFLQGYRVGSIMSRRGEGPQIVDAGTPTAGTSTYHEKSFLSGMAAGYAGKGVWR